jgi:ERCC4-type nuclease
MKIKIDVREKKLIELLKSNEEIISKKYEISVETLNLGDIIISNDEDKELILIERKSISDLASSIMDGRYSEQSFRLNSCDIHNHNIVYLIEGNLLIYRPYSKINKKALYSAICQLNYYKGFSVLRTINIQETAEIIIRLFDKIVREKKEDGFYNKMSVFESIPLGTATATATETAPALPTETETETATETATKTEIGQSKLEYVDVIKREKKANITPENIHIIMLCQIPNISSVSAKAILKHYDYKTLISDINNVDLTTIKIQSSDGKERKISKKVIENLKKYLK